MAITSLADMQTVPPKMGNYVIQRTLSRSALIRSGIAEPDPEVARLIGLTPRGCTTISIPFYKPLDNKEARQMTESELTVDKIETGSNIAVLLAREKAWGNTYFAAAFGGSDPAQAIADQTGDYWVGQDNMSSVSISKGLLDPSYGCLKAHVLDITKKAGTDCIISVNNTLDTKQLLGDAAGSLAAIAMDSATFTNLQKQNLIVTIPASDTQVKIDTYLGYEVIVDDALASSDDTHLTILYGKGAFSYNIATLNGVKAVEPYHDALKGIDALVNRRAAVIHPRGCQFVGSEFTGGANTPSNADLEKAANWKASADLKSIPIVALRHKLTANPAAPEAA